MYCKEQLWELVKLKWKAKMKFEVHSPQQEEVGLQGKL